MRLRNFIVGVSQNYKFCHPEAEPKDLLFLGSTTAPSGHASRRDFEDCHPERSEGPALWTDGELQIPRVKIMSTSWDKSHPSRAAAV